MQKTLEQVGISNEQHLITVHYEEEGSHTDYLHYEDEGLYECDDSWNRNNMGEKVNLGKDLQTLTINKEFCWTSACMTREINCGIHSWMFELEEYHGQKGVNGWHLLIGIWKTHKINMKHINYFYATAPNSGYVYVASDGLLCDPQKGAINGQEYGIILNEYDTPYLIEMIVDLNNRTVSYLINHKHYGIAFSDIEQCTYVAAISFMPYLGTQKLKFISYKNR